jgi:hypothetical protein
MKKEIVSSLAIVTLSTMPAQALNFGTGNAYDKYLACHKNKTENTSIQDDELKNKKLYPELPIIPSATKIQEQKIMLKYGVPYPPEAKPVQPIYETKYGIPYPKENTIKNPNIPLTRYGINIPR